MSIENNKPKGSRERIEELHVGIPHADIKNIKDKLEDRAPVSQDKETNHTKAEINALTSILIEQIWSRAVRNIERNPPGLATKDDVFGAHVLTEEEVKQICNREKMRSEDVLNFLKYSSANFLIKELVNWEVLEESKFTIHPDDKENKVYARLRNLLLIRQKTPNFHLGAGINTAIVTIWETVGVLSTVYKSQFKTPLPKEKLVELAKNALPLIYHLAASHLEVFVQLRDQYQWELEEPQLEGFRGDRFYFMEDKGSLKLEFKEPVTKGIPKPEIVEPRTGCPAIYSRGPKGKNVILEMFEWILELAEKYYIPVLKREGKII